MGNGAKKWWIFGGVAGCAALLCFAAGLLLIGSFIASRAKGRDSEPGSASREAAPPTEVTAPGVKSEEADEAPAETGPLKAGEHVDYPEREAHATIDQIGADGIHIVLDGCPAYLAKNVVHEGDLRRTAKLARSSEAVRALFGKWSMFEPGTFNTTTRGNEVFREWGMGAKTPPLTINDDGTFVWVEDSQHTTRGRWRTDARVRDLPPKATPSMEGNAYHDGVMIRDAENNEWKVYRTVSEGKGEESIGVAQLCQEVHSFMGTKL